MAHVKIRFEVMNEVQVSRMFETIEGQVLNLSKPFGEMAQDFYQSMVSEFSAEGAHEGNKKWEDLSPAYRQWKQRHYPGKKILELTGRLKGSITTSGSPDSVLDVQYDSLTVGTRVPYAVHHQTGTPRMPMRKIIDLTDLQARRWTQIMHVFLFSLYDEAAKSTRS